jgi:MFS family permease
MKLKPRNSPPAAPKWLNRTVLGIGLASLCSDVGHEMATTAMPALLASFGAGSALLGLIEGTADGLSSFAKLLSGVYSDRLRRRKPLAVAGYFVTASAMASFAFATQTWHVFLGRVLGWIGRGTRSPVRSVLLSEATVRATYGRAFGLDRAMDSAGAVIGPALSLLFVSIVGLHWTFLLTLVPGLLAVALIMWMVREKPHSPDLRHGAWHGIGRLPREFRKYLVGVGIAGIGDFSNTLLILWATQAWMPGMGREKAAACAMAFYIGYNVVYSASCYLSGLLADHFPKQRVLAIGYSVAVIPAIALMLPGVSFAKFAVVFGFSGLYMGVWETLEQTTAATILPRSQRGKGFGVLATVNGMGGFIASASVGVLWMFSPIWAMTLVIITSVGGAAVIATTKPVGEVDAAE